MRMLPVVLSVLVGLLGTGRDARAAAPRVPQEADRAGAGPTAAGGSAAAPGGPQETDRIGLVLAGGGARGLAHLGVFRWLEEHRVPVHVVAGTSMGALIGALHATGRDAEDMIEFARAVDWGWVLEGRPRYGDLSFRRKEDLRAHPGRVELGLAGGLSLPASLSPAHASGLILDQIAYPYSLTASFDDLPTPFRCVAVDLVEGEEVVFSDGPLWLALRSTMAFPGLFAPVHDGGRVLVDGGVLDNLPVHVAREAGATRIIAVDIGRPRPDPAELASLPQILERTVDVMTQSNVTPARADADVVVDPEVEEIGLLEFGAIEELIERGHAAAEAARDELLPLALAADAWEEWVEARRRRTRRPEDLVPSFVSVAGAEATDTGRVLERLQGHVGDPLDFTGLHHDLTRVVGNGEYLSSGYAAVRQGDATGLAIRVTPKSHGPPFLFPIVDLRGGGSFDTAFTLGARLRFDDVVGLRSEVRADLSVGLRDRAAAEVWVPLGGRWFVAPAADVETVTQVLFADGEKVAEYRVRAAGAAVDVGRAFGNVAELRLGVRGAHVDAGVEIGDPRLPSLDGLDAAARVGFRYDDLDSPFIPTHGDAVDAEVSWVAQSPGASGAFPQASFQLLGARTLTDRTSAVLRLQGATTFGDEAPPFRDFLLGGPLRLAALGLGEDRGDHLALVTAGVVHSLTDGPLPVLGTPYAGVLYEAGDAFDDRVDLFHDVTAALLSETGIGVLLVGVALGEEGRHQVFFSLGPLF